MKIGLTAVSQSQYKKHKSAQNKFSLSFCSKRKTVPKKQDEQHKLEQDRNDENKKKFKFKLATQAQMKNVAEIRIKNKVYSRNIKKSFFCSLVEYQI